jgi:hypothetical protein
LLGVMLEKIDGSKCWWSFCLGLLPLMLGSLLPLMLGTVSHS